MFDVQLFISAIVRKHYSLSLGFKSLNVVIKVNVSHDFDVLSVIIVQLNLLVSCYFHLGWMYYESPVGRRLMSLKPIGMEC